LPPTVTVFPAVDIRAPALFRQYPLGHIVLACAGLYRPQLNDKDLQMID